MKALRRILLAMIGLADLAVGVLFVVAMLKHGFGADVVDFMENFLAYNMQLWFVDSIHLWEPILLSLLFVVLGMILLIIALYRGRTRSMVKVNSDDGNTVQISREAIATVVRQAVSEIPLIENAQTELLIKKGSLRVVLHITLPMGSSIPQLGAEARYIVNERLNSILSITPREIAVQVADMAESSVPLPPLSAPAADKPAAAEYEFTVAEEDRPAVFIEPESAGETEEDR